MGAAGCRELYPVVIGKHSEVMPVVWCWCVRQTVLPAAVEGSKQAGSELSLCGSASCGMVDLGVT